MDEGDSIQLQLSPIGEDEHTLDVPLTVFRLIVCVFGILGNLLVIFVILVLAEYRKAVTHWYVLQLAIADSIFLLTIPFRVVEDIENGWTFPVWMCKAKETILFLNYYSSVSFLVVMSIDRYIAVCHGFSSFLQKFRTPLAAAIITVTVWGICLLICIPIMMYSTPRGHKPNCKCEYQFPKPFNATETCLREGEEVGTDSFDRCIEQLEGLSDEACTNLSTISFGSGGGLNLTVSLDGVEDFNDLLGWGAEETTPSPDDGGDYEDTSGGSVFLQPGCHYFDYADGFKAFIWFNFIVMFLFPLAVMTVCYVLIIRRLYGTRFRSESVGGADTSSTGNRPPSVSSGNKKRTRSAASARNNRNRVRVTIMCASMVILFFVCWLPFHAVHLAKFAGIQGTSEFCLRLFYAVSLIAFANSAINPYLYNFIGTRFGKRLRRVRESKTAKAFFSLASGVAKGAGRHSTTSGAEHNYDNTSKRNKKEQTEFNGKDTEYVTLAKDMAKDDDASVELLRKFPVYTGPTAQQPLPYESQLNSEPPPYREQSNTTTESERMKTEPPTAKPQQ